ncbi:glutamate 5-kinase [Paracoccaceae bacterium GXU_MW_L88]
METLSQDRLSRASRVVIKIGSALLVGPDGLRRDWLAGLVEDVAMLRAEGKQVILVSSGSIALGRREMGLPAGDLQLEAAQAAAAVGQIHLAQAYTDRLATHALKAAQILVTLEDSRIRSRYLNSRSTLAALLDHGIVPIVNENDTVATDEIRFGDNDRLAAQIALTASADCLFLLSDVDGLYTADPRHDPSAKHIPTITEITPEIDALAGEAGPGAKGGMKTKLMAARIAMQAGAAMAIMKGEVMRPISALRDGARASWFVGHETPKSARKNWIAGMKPHGKITIDEGAARALEAGRSLLAAGVSDVAGQFSRGDCVEVIHAGRVLGHGLTSYDAAQARAIAGRQSADIAVILGGPARGALIHRDNLVL